MAADPNIKRGRFVYTDDDLQAVVDLVNEQGIAYRAEDVQALLQFRTGKDITLSGAKNLLTRLRNQGLIPSKTPDRPNNGGRKKKPKPKAKSNLDRSPADMPPPPKVKVPKPFDPHMTADDLFDFNVQVIYAELDKMPVAHLGPLHDFRKACEALLEALSK